MASRARASCSIIAAKWKGTDNPGVIVAEPGPSETRNGFTTPKIWEIYQNAEINVSMSVSVTFGLNGRPAPTRHAMRTRCAPKEVHKCCSGGRVAVMRSYIGCS